jgi:peptide/nickel transport system permease protein
MSKIGHTLPNVAPIVISDAPLGARRTSYWDGVVRRIISDRVTACCGTILLLIVLMALLAPQLAPADPNTTSIVRRLYPIGSPGHLLGTDELGRDMLSRLIFGTRLSLFMGITPVLFALLFGTMQGVTAGYVGGWVNTIIMRVTDVFFAFPSILLAVAISGALGAGIGNAILSLTIVFIPPITRVAESVTTQIRTADFLDAARASGVGTARIVRVHVLRNVLGPIIVYATSLISVSMIIASGLSFLGIGVEPPNAEWGLMLNTLRPAIFVNPTIAALPGVMIFITSICFSLFSDGMRAAMEVKS